MLHQSEVFWVCQEQATRNRRLTAFYEPFGFGGIQGLKGKSVVSKRCGAIHRAIWSYRTEQTVIIALFRP